MAEVYRLQRGLIKVGGADAVAFLDNLLTQNVARLCDAGLLHAALLTPQGKVSADMLLWRDSDGVLIETDAAFAKGLLHKLSLYKLRAAVTIEDVSNRVGVLWSAEPFDGATPDPRLAGAALGWRKIGADAAPDGDAAYAAHRLAQGAPDLSVDAAQEEVFGLEALLEEMHGVDFGKGCFVGQENVSRMKRRATTRRKFCPIVFNGPAPPPLTPLTAGNAEIGTVRTGGPGRAIALVRLDRAAEASEAGLALEAGGLEVRLDPPSWLILPATA